jgi:hypothetical protein
MEKSDNWRPGPEVERANHFDAAFCGDPNCGLHIVPCRKDGTPICEVVMSAAQTLALVEVCQDFLYEKAVKKT